MLHNKLFRVIRAHLLGFSPGNSLSWKRFCLFCPFHTSLSFTGCLVQLVYTNFPNRVIHTPMYVFVDVLLEIPSLIY